MSTINNKKVRFCELYILQNSSDDFANLVAQYGTDIMKDESEDHTVKLRNLGDWFAGISSIESQKVKEETSGI